MLRAMSADADQSAADPADPADARPAKPRWWLWGLATVGLALVISCSGIALLQFAASRAGSATGSAGGLTVTVRGPGGVSASGGPTGPRISATVGGRPVVVTPDAVAPAGAAPIPLPPDTARVELSTGLFSDRLTVEADGAELWTEPAGG